MNLEKICNQVIELSTEVATFISKEFEQFDTDNIEYKGRNDLVSYVDKEAEKRLVNQLEKILPEAGFIAEEGSGSRNPKGYNWIVDPLDGTTNFIHGIPFFAISIALIKDDELQLGVVYSVRQKECFHAVKGGKAYCNQQEISVSKTQALNQGLLATGFPYADFDDVSAYMKALEILMQKCHGLRRIGSAALDLSYVAAGRFNAFFEYNLNSWDVAAGALIVQQAGGKVSDFNNGNDYVFGKQILAAASENSQKEILEIVEKYLTK